MASSFFFGGRLYSTPSVMSLVNDAAMAPTSLTVGNILCLVGASTGGQPQTPLRFGSPSEALATLVSGPLCDAAVAAFSASPQTNAPSTVMCVRVGAATQASLTLVDGSAVPVIDLTTKAYGLIANQTNIKIAAGSSTGKLVTVSYGTSYATQDNITRTAFTIQYTGAQTTASMTITNSTMLLFAPNLTAVGNFTFASYPTVQQLVNIINSVPGFAATALVGSANTITDSGLDSVSAVDVKTSLYSAKADLQAIIDYLNSAADPYVSAVRHTNAGTVPANIGPVYLTGGTSPAPVTGDWTTAFSLLQGQDLQWLCPLVGDASIHAAADAHCQFMSTVGRRERRAVVGPALGVSLSAVQALPFAINSDRTTLCWPGHYAFNSAGVLTLFDPFMTAAKVAAGFAGLNPGDAMTNKLIVTTGLETTTRDPTDTDPLIQSGVCVIMQTPTGYRVARSISTWLTNNNFNRVETSCGAAVDFVVRNVRNALQPLKGGRNDPTTLGQAISITESALRQLSIPQPQGPGTLVGNAASPPWQNIQASIAGDVLSVSFQCSPVIPTNFIPLTVSIVPFTGTLTQAFA
jgi:hypothetical protein